ncbi:MAG: hypothetical protein IPN34_27445 [Planctomycetes bacterium]|nr:hypothetical protein [Planctomycetota bacterium]
MKPLAVGTWNFSGTLAERLAKCARAGFRWIELRDDEPTRALALEELDAHGLGVALFEESTSHAFDPRAIGSAAALGARAFLHAARDLGTLPSRIALASAHGLRSLVRASDPAAQAHPELALLWDSWDAEGRSLDATALAPRLGYLRFRDGRGAERTALGGGEVDLRAQMRALSEVLRVLPCWGIDFEGCPQAEREARKATGFLRARAIELTPPSI